MACAADPLSTTADSSIKQKENFPAIRCLRTARISRHESTGDGVILKAIRPRQEQARRRLASLTAREHQVAAAIAQGQSNADIAAQLHMSLATVKAHVSRLLAKLGAANRVQIALLVQDAATSRPHDPR